VKQSSPATDHTLLLALLALFLFHSPFANWWLGQHPAWYMIFIVWLSVIALVAINRWRISRHNGQRNGQRNS